MLDELRPNIIAHIGRDKTYFKINVQDGAISVQIFNSVLDLAISKILESIVTSCAEVISKLSPFTILLFSKVSISSRSHILSKLSYPNG